MIDGHFRKILPNHTTALIHFYRRLGLTPNQITVAALGLACIAAFLTAQGLAWLALVTWWAGRLLDGTDGIYARATNQASEFGAFLDILSDMAAYSIMIIGFAILHPDLIIQWMVTLVLYVLCVTGALSLGAIEQKLGLASNDNRGIRLGAGLAEGGETGIAYSLFLIFPDHVLWLSTLWILLLISTVLFRGLLAYKVLSKIDGKEPS